MLDSRNPTPSKSFMTPDVTIPRQLAPTVGPAVKGVTFRAGSMKGAEDLVVGRIITVDGTPLIDDSSWGPEADYLETGHVIPFGSINVFVGFIGGDSLQEGDSVEEVADDGDQSVESVDSQEFGSIMSAVEESLWGCPQEATLSPDREAAQVAVYTTTGVGASGTAGEAEAPAPPSN